MKFNLIQIQTTGTCNARCEMCPYKDSWFIDNHGIMTDDLFNKILYNIKEEDPNCKGRICPYLMNEPFADPKMLDRIDKIKKVFPNAILEVSTNTELLNTNKINKLVELLGPKDKIVISHHGTDKESFENTMHINYEKCLDNAIELIRSVDGKTPIAIQDMAISIDGKFRYHSPREIKRYWNGIFENNNLSWNNVWLSTLEFHNRAGNVNMEEWGYDKVVRKIDKTHPFSCKKLYHTLNVLWNGEVVLCCMDYMHETPFGNLNKQSIYEVFKSLKWKKLYDQCTGNIESPDDFICKRCQTGG